MGIRPFEWRDLPTLLRYRKRGIFLDTASVLTRGEILVPVGAMLTYFAPATGIFTFLRTNDDPQGEALLGQVKHAQDESLARLSFLAPVSELDGDTLVPLLEYVFQQIGQRGAFHLMAEIEDGNTVFDNLRKAGFALYVHQRIWKSPPAGDPIVNPSHWREITGRDLIAIRSLYNMLVPPLVQQVEPLPTEQTKGQVYYLDGEIKAYTEVRYGQQGIWIQPFIHPDIRDATQVLADLMSNLPNRHSRPIFLCIRTYQSWLENSLEDLQANAGPKQAVLVKHLAVAQQVKSSFSLPALEGGQQEITTPFMRSERNNN